MYWEGRENKNQTHRYIMNGKEYFVQLLNTDIADTFNSKRKSGSKKKVTSMSKKHLWWQK